MADNMGFKQQLAQVKESYNIVDVIQDENVSLKPSGPSQYKGLCPFHSEKTPSFVVNENFQNYRCFGCGESGDIFNFIEKIRGCSFIDAVKYLAEMQNITIDLGNMVNDNEPHVDLKALYTLLQDSYNFYRAEYEKLPDSHPAKKEIIDRGLDPEDPVFCYSPERYNALIDFLSSKGYSEELMLQSELVSKNESGKLYDFFHARLMITLSDFSGRPVSYSARKLFDNDTRAKYINGKQSPVFQKKSTLFNLNNAKKYIRDSKKAIVCEGPFDVLALEKAGIKNSVASCGTAFTEEQLRSIEQIVDVDGNIIFSFDGDDAGIEAAVKTFLHFPLIHGNGSVVLFPEDLDPCDYLVKYGPEQMHIPLENEKPLIDFVLDEIAKKKNITDMQSRYKFAQLVMSKYAPVVTDKVLQNYFIRRTSVLSGIEVESLQQLLKQPRKQFTAKSNQKKQSIQLEIKINPHDDVDKCYLSVLIMLVNNPSELFPLLKNAVIPDKFKPILRELRDNCAKYIKNNEPIRIIPEEYNEPNFIKYLQNANLLIDYENTNEVMKHFQEVLRLGKLNYEAEQRKQKKLAISQALSGAKSNEEIIKLLKIANQGES